MSDKLANQAAKCHITIVRHDRQSTQEHFTHFVTGGELIISLHALLALASARPIVTTQWLEQSVAEGTILDAKPYLVQDGRAEHEHHFVYASSWSHARSKRMLEGALGMPLLHEWHDAHARV